MLDDRQYRDADVCTPLQAGSSTFDPKSCAALTSPNRTLLGIEQEQWIAGSLKNSRKSDWNVIGQPTLYAQRYFGAEDNKKIWSDGWDGFPAARKRLDQIFIKNKVKNLVIFGGDVHQNWVGYLKEDYDNPNSETLGVEFCGTSISSKSGGVNVSQALKNNPHFIFAETSRRGYGVADFRAQELNVTLRVLLDPREKESGVENLATFRVLSGSNRIEKLS
jgi:alkaline phosphatase D